MIYSAAYQIHIFQLYTFYIGDGHLSYIHPIYIITSLLEAQSRYS